jgi:hypothetical protein
MHAQLNVHASQRLQNLGGSAIVSELGEVKTMGLMIWIVFCLIIASIPAGAKEHKDSSWQSYAQAYVELNQRMYDHKASDHDAIVEQFRLHYDLEQKLSRSTSPSKKEWQRMAQSADPLQRRMALVLAIAKKLRDPDFTRVLIARYSDETDVFVKLYIHRLLGYQTDRDLRGRQQAIVKMIGTDKSDELRIAGLSTLLKLDWDVVYPVLFQHVETGSKGLIRAIYFALRGKGDSCLDQVIQDLVKKDKKEVLAMFESFDKD